MSTPGYHALHEGLALMTEGRVVFHLSGARAERVVNGLVTNAVDGLGDGRGCYAFALTAKGRPLTDMRVLPTPGFEIPSAAAADESAWIDVPEAGADGFRDLLTRSVPPIFATVEEIPIKRLSLTGPDTAHFDTVLAKCGLVAVDGQRYPSDPLRAVTASLVGCEHMALIVSREAIEGDGVDLYVPSGDADLLEACLAEAIARAGGRRATAADWEVVRVERGIPRYGAEITIDHLPQETGQVDRAVSFSKGCYTGQEVVARIHYRGHVNQLLRGVRLRQPPGGSAPERPSLEPGDAAYADDREVGRVVTAVSSPRFGPIGLAYIRRTIDPGRLVSRAPAGPRDLEVIELPFT